jgi:hypothetical protein
MLLLIHLNVKNYNWFVLNSIYTIKYISVAIFFFFFLLLRNKYFNIIQSFLFHVFTLEYIHSDIWINNTYNFTRRVIIYKLLPIKHSFPRLMRMLVYNVFKPFFTGLNTLYTIIIMYSNNPFWLVWIHYIAYASDVESCLIGNNFNIFTFC